MSAFGRPMATLILPLLLAFAILPMSTANGARYAALVVEEQSGRVLYALNANARRHPASLTKMMTLYLLFDALDKGVLALDDRLSVSLRATRQSPTRLAPRASPSRCSSLPSRREERRKTPPQKLAAARRYERAESR